MQRITQFAYKKMCIVVVVLPLLTAIWYCSKTYLLVLMCFYYSTSALLAMQSAVLARGIMSVRLSVCLTVCPSRSGIVSRRMKIRSCGFQHLVGQSSSFWRGKVYLVIRRGSPPAGALKWGTPLSIGKLRQIIGHNLETAQYKRLVTINH